MMIATTPLTPSTEDIRTRFSWVPDVALILCRAVVLSPPLREAALIHPDRRRMRIRLRSTEHLTTDPSDGMNERTEVVIHYTV
jgi:hypothetical protein